MCIIVVIVYHPLVSHFCCFKGAGGGGGGAFMEIFLKIDFLLVSNRGELYLSDAFDPME